jgi:hypothetical protein
MSAACGWTGASDPSLDSVVGAAAAAGSVAVVGAADAMGSVPVVIPESIGVVVDIMLGSDELVGVFDPLALFPPDFGDSGPSAQERSIAIRLKTPRDRFSTSVASRLTAVCRRVMSMAK